MTSRAAKPPVIRLLCPSCRAVRPCKPIGAATVAKRRREVLECCDESCGLQWLPARGHIPAPPADAVPRGLPFLAGARVDTAQDGGR